MANHKLFIIRLLELLTIGKDRICFGASDEYPDGKIEIKPHGQANGELYGHVQFYQDKSCLSFYKENPALTIRFMGKDPDQFLDTIVANGEAVWVSPVYGQAIVARYEDIPYDETIGFCCLKQIKRVIVCTCCGQYVDINDFKTVSDRESICSYCDAHSDVVGG